MLHHATIYYAISGIQIWQTNSAVANSHLQIASFRHVWIVGRVQHMMGHVDSLHPAICCTSGLMVLINSKVTLSASANCPANSSRSGFSGKWKTWRVGRLAQGLQGRKVSGFNNKIDQIKTIRENEETCILFAFSDTTAPNGSQVDKLVILCKPQAPCKYPAWTSCPVITWKCWQGTGGKRYYSMPSASNPFSDISRERDCRYCQRFIIKQNTL